jgi:PAS domain S-box-containing protein
MANTPRVESPAAGAGDRPGRAVLAAAVDGAVELLGAARVAVLLPVAGALRCVARRGISDGDAAALAEMLGRGDAARTLDCGRALATSTGDELPAPLRSWLASRGEREILVSPLPDTGNPTGALVVGYDSPSRVTAARVSAAARFAAPVALAIAASRRAARAEGREPPPADGGDAVDRRDHRRQVEFAQALTDVLRWTVAAGDVATASEGAAAVVLRAMPGVDLVNVWVVGENDSNLHRVVTAGERLDAPARPDLLPLEEDVGAALALNEGRILVWQGDRASWPERLRLYAEQTDLTTVAHVPMHSSGRVTGVLTLGSHQQRAYTDAEQGFLASLAGQLAGQLDAVRGLERVESERRRLNSLLETLPEGLLIVQQDGTVTLHNQTAVDILGKEPSGGSGESLLSGCTANSAEGRPLQPGELPLTRALRGETVRAAEIRLRRADGSEVPLLVSAGPVRGPDGEVAGAICAFQDISRLKELDRLKDEFINTVSHELRTPTTTIRGGALTLLKRGDRLDEATRRELLQDIADESERLHHLVEDLLSLSRSRAGLRISLEPLRLHRLVNKVVLDLGSRLGGYALTVDVPHDLPMVEADALVVEQILRNLLENAAKYSPRGGRVELTADARDGQVVVTVADRGTGIPKEDLDRVFEPFYRSPTAVRSGTQGAGLGLAVCRRLVELYGGRIWAEARPGGGSAFRFTLSVVADDTIV